MTKTSKAKRGRKATATVESVTRELNELVSRHSNSEWESAHSHNLQYRRIRERELKKKDLTTEERARLLDEQKGYQAGYSLHEKKRNLQKRLDKLIKDAAEPSEGDKPPDIPKQDVFSRAVESESFIPHQPAPEADDIPPVPQLTNLAELAKEEATSNAPIEVLPSARPMSVTTLAGKQIVINNVGKHTTVKYIKQYIVEKLSISVDDQYLIYGGVELESDHLLSHYGITHGSTMVLFPRSGTIDDGTNCPLVQYSLDVNRSGSSGDKSPSPQPVATTVEAEQEPVVASETKKQQQQQEYPDPISQLMNPGGQPMQEQPPPQQQHHHQQVIQRHPMPPQMNYGDPPLHYGHPMYPPPQMMHHHPHHGPPPHHHHPGYSMYGMQQEHYPPPPPPPHQMHHHPGYYPPHPMMMGQYPQQQMQNQQQQQQQVLPSARPMPLTTLAGEELVINNGITHGSTSVLFPRSGTIDDGYSLDVNHPNEEVRVDDNSGLDSSNNEENEESHGQLEVQFNDYIIEHDEAQSEDQSESQINDHFNEDQGDDCSFDSSLCPDDVSLQDDDGWYCKVDEESKQVDEESSGHHQIVYICWLENHDLFEAIRTAEINHDGSTEFFTLLSQLTKIGRARKWKTFWTKIRHMRGFNNFARLRFIALSYNGNSCDAEEALHIAYSLVRHNGEWFRLNTFDRACIASVFERIKERVGGVIRYGCTPWGLRCYFTMPLIDYNPDGRVYFAKYGWKEREETIINKVLAVPGLDDSIEEGCTKMRSCKIGCVYQGLLRERLGKMLWACGFIDSINYNFRITNQPRYDEKREHCEREEHWTQHGEWFLQVEGEFNCVAKRRRRIRSEFDFDYYGHLIDTGFISLETVHDLILEGTLM